MNPASQIAKDWLRDNKPKFASSDGLPSDYYREHLFLSIKPGGRVVIQTPHGSLVEGRAVMKGPAGWVLNLGGDHGTPGIACEGNVVWVTGASKVLGFK